MDKTNYCQINPERGKNELVKTINSIKESAEVLEKAKQAILVKGFKDEQEEIVFFKQRKPYMLANILYHRKI